MENGKEEKQTRRRSWSPEQREAKIAILVSARAARAANARCPEKTLARFMQKVQKSKDPDGCWIWKGYTDKLGYGRFGAGRRQKNILAHRFLIRNEIPEGMCACHRCDNPSCVNPDHIFIGTKKDNSQDMARKGRSKIPTPRFGKENNMTKLRNEDVVEIRRLYQLGLSARNIHSHFSQVTHATICNIIRGITWKNVEGETEYKLRYPKNRKPRQPISRK